MLLYDSFLTLNSKCLRSHRDHPDFSSQCLEAVTKDMIHSSHISALNAFLQTDCKLDAARFCAEEQKVG